MHLASLRLPWEPRSAICTGKLAFDPGGGSGRGTDNERAAKRARREFDGQSFKAIQVSGIDRFLTEISDGLITGMYQPQPNRRAGYTFARSSADALRVWVKQILERQPADFVRMTLRYLWCNCIALTLQRWHFSMNITSVPGSLSEFVAPETTALVIWDMQKGLAGRALHREKLQTSVTALLNAADRIGVLVVWSRHILPPLELQAGPSLLFQMRKAGVSRVEDLRPSMQAGGEDTDFLPGLHPARHHIVLEKSQPSFFVDTPLDLRLKARGIKTIVLAGVATDIGIEFTARHASASGYYAVIAEDACGSYTDEAHANSMTYLRKWMVVASTQEIVQSWPPQAGRKQTASTPFL